MENASKALLIAAAVLIVILLVAFGMSIFNSAKSSADADSASTAISQGITSATEKLEQSMRSKEAREFNKQFEGYLGKNKSASACNELSQLIKSHNEKSEKKVGARNGDNTELSGTYASKYSEFTISAKYDENGFIKTIYFTGTKEK